MREFLKYWGLPIGFITFVIGFILFIIATPTNTSETFRDDNLVCLTTKKWGFGENKKKCYRYYDLDLKVADSPDLKTDIGNLECYGSIDAVVQDLLDRGYRITIPGDPNDIDVNINELKEDIDAKKK